MKKTIVLCSFAILFSFISCSKDENPTGYADKVAGTYNGTMTFGSLRPSCTTYIVKTSGTKVRLTITIDDSSFIFGEIAVQNTGNDTYSLSYTDQSGYLNGRVEGDELTYSVYSGVLNSMFTGTR